MDNVNTLSNEELIKRIQAGDETAKERFVKQNTPLVYAIIKRFHKQRGMHEDLFQIGCIGLMKALNHFDLSYQVKFSTYAVPIIMGEIKRFFRDDGSMRISRSLKEGYLQMVKAKEDLIQSLGRDVSYQEIAAYLKLEVSDVILAFEANQFVYSLDETIYENDGSPIHLEDKVTHPKERDLVLELALKKEMRHLEERERILLYYRYEKNMKQEEIAKRLGVSQVQVSRLEKKVLAKLKARLVNG
ncbi:MAG: SigB/SigF/SigG family RNA polymerase sigma factor [Erysipelotrichaceae bacterium]|nr:SigB/SigF/SigG family RNA polymerase sigma factor [Erysipelotrichaceae bacterium]